MLQERGNQWKIVRNTSYLILKVKKEKKKKKKSERERTCDLIKNVSKLRVFPIQRSHRSDIGQARVVNNSAPPRPPPTDTHPHTRKTPTHNTSLIIFPSPLQNISQNYFCFRLSGFVSLLISFHFICLFENIYIFLI